MLTSYLRLRNKQYVMVLPKQASPALDKVVANLARKAHPKLQGAHLTTQKTRGAIDKYYGVLIARLDHMWGEG